MKIKNILKHRLIKTSGIYIFGTLLTKAIPFFIIPIITRYLSPSDFGVVATFTALIGIIQPFLSMSIPSFLEVQYFTLEKKNFKVYFPSFISLLIALLILTSIICWLFLPLFKSTDIISLKWILILIGHIFFLTLGEIFLSLLKITEKPYKFNLYQIFRTLINFSLSCILIISFNMGWEGRLFGIAGSSLISGIFVLFFIRKFFTPFKVSLTHIKESLHYGLPLIPHALSGWVMTASDRFFINHYVGLEENGIYSLGYQIGMIMGILVYSFSYVWNPFLFKTLNDKYPDTDKKIVKFTYLFFIVIAAVAIMLGYLAPFIIKIFATEPYYPAIKFVPWVAFAYAVNGMYMMVAGYIFYVKKTKYVAISTTCGALLNIILNFILVPRFQGMGAIWATLIANVFILFSTWYFSMKLYPMPWFKAFKKMRS